MVSFFDRHRNFFLALALACSTLSMATTGYLYLHQAKPYKLVADNAIGQLQQGYLVEELLREEHKPLQNRGRELQEAQAKYSERKEAFEKKQAKLPPAKRKRREAALKQEAQRLQEQHQHFSYQVVKMQQGFHKRFRAAVKATSRALCQQHGWAEIVVVTHVSVDLLGDEKNDVSEAFVKALKKCLEGDSEEDAKAQA